MQHQLTWGEEDDQASFQRWKEKLKDELDPSWSERTFRQMYEAWNRSENKKRDFGEQ